MKVEKIKCNRCGVCVPDPLYVDEVSKKPCDDCHQKIKGGENGNKQEI